MSVVRAVLGAVLADLDQDGVDAVQGGQAGQDGGLQGGPLVLLEVLPDDVLPDRPRVVPAVPQGLEFLEDGRSPQVDAHGLLACQLICWYCSRAAILLFRMVIMFGMTFSTCVLSCRA